MKQKKLKQQIQMRMKMNKKAINKRKFLNGIKVIQ